MGYSIKENEDTSISLALPCVSYEMFQRVQGYRQGLFYKDYYMALACLVHKPRFGTEDTLLNFKRKMITKQEELLTARKIVKYETTYHPIQLSDIG